MNPHPTSRDTARLAIEFDLDDAIQLVLDQVTDQATLGNTSCEVAAPLNGHARKALCEALKELGYYTLPKYGTPTLYIAWNREADALNSRDHAYVGDITNE